MMDLVTRLVGVPMPSAGVPSPFVFADEQHLVIGYYVARTSAESDNHVTPGVERSTAGDSVALIQFVQPYAHSFGAPNDEGIVGHSLWNRGLRPYSMVEVTNSSWIHKLGRMNAVHPAHDPAQFALLRHFVFSFHDSMFECVAEDLTISVRMSALGDVWAQVQASLGW